MLDKKINEFEVGEEVQGFFIIKSFNVKTSSNNKKYLDFTLADRTGEVNAKLWDVKDEYEELYQAGVLVKVRGAITSWQNNVQLKVIKIRLTTEEDQINLSDYVPSAPYDPREMFDELVEVINGFKNNDLKRLVLHIVKEYEEPLLTAPAAKSNHHAIRSGLLYHLKRMIKTGKALCQIYTHINEDLLIAGIILHDMEKINEMVSDHLGIVSDYSTEGQLLGHIIMGIKKIDTVARALGIDPELSMVLQHLVLSHHYEPEFGSPKKPMLPEGELLHYIDIIDARMYDMELAYRDVPVGDFTAPVWVLDKRRLYNYKESQND
ncbi:MAG: HD domain-containing protein [Clostridia bacterium]|nr:HD domain-containing protein [Clostridia bacterium]